MTDTEKAVLQWAIRFGDSEVPAPIVYGTDAIYTLWRILYLSREKSDELIKGELRGITVYWSLNKKGLLILNKLERNLK